MTQLGRILGGAKAGLNLTLLLCLFGGTVMAQEPKVTPLMSKELKDIPGKEVLMITVEYVRAGRTRSTGTMQQRLFMCWRVLS